MNGHKARRVVRTDIEMFQKSILKMGKKMEFIVENLSCGQADCFLISLENELGDTCTILVDGNRQGKKSRSLENIIARIEKLDKLDYIIVTHVDNDHLGGILSLFQYFKKDRKDIAQKLEETIIVYNCISQGLISYRQAREFERLICDRKVIGSYCNRYDNSGSMLKLLQVPLRKILSITAEKNRNAYLTFLGPNRAGVNAVANDYLQYYDDGTKPDAVLINKNSIAFLLEFGGKKVLFTGDAFLTDVQNLLLSIEDEHNPIKIDLMKIPHHGAEKYNVGIGEFVRKHQCTQIILTAAETWDNKHPAESVMKELSSALSGAGRIYTEADLTQIKDEYGRLQNGDSKIIIV